jgi:hypothetical protein
MVLVCLSWALVPDGPSAGYNLLYAFKGSLCALGDLDWVSLNLGRMRRLVAGGLNGEKATRVGRYESLCL